MIAIDTYVDARRVRVFFTTLPSTPDEAREAAENGFFDDDLDKDREIEIRTFLAKSGGMVRARAYPTEGDRDVLQLYFETDEGPLFCCVLMTEARLRKDPPRRIVEGLSLQVIQGEHLSVDGIRTSANVWLGRCFPDVAVGMFVELWSTVTGIHRERLDLLVKRNVTSVGAGFDPLLGVELEPDPSIVQPPLESVAA